jgi:hypothetical protein
MDEPVARDIGADAVCEPGHRISTDKSASQLEWGPQRPPSRTGHRAFVV